jgi:hypothetical protein
MKRYAAGRSDVKRTLKSRATAIRTGVYHCGFCWLSESRTEVACNERTTRPSPPASNPSIISVSKSEVG